MKEILINYINDRDKVNIEELEKTFGITFIEIYNIICDDNVVVTESQLIFLPVKHFLKQKLNKQFPNTILTI